MFKSIFEIIKDFDLEINGKKFDNPIDFLSIDDSFFYNLNNHPREIKPIIKNILNRTLLKRALVIGKDFLAGDKDEINENFQIIMKNLNDYEKVRELRYLIADEVEEISSYEFWIDFPTPPSLRESSQCYIKIKENKYETLDKLFPTSGWLNTFIEHKLKGYVFCPPNKNIREKVFEKTTRIFEDEFGIYFTEDSKYLAKIE